jgi:hypothetical protein
VALCVHLGLRRYGHNNNPESILKKHKTQVQGSGNTHTRTHGTRMCHMMRTCSSCHMSHTHKMPNNT